MGEGREGRGEKLFLAPRRWPNCSPQARVALGSEAETAERPAPAPLLARDPSAPPRARPTPPPGGRGPGPGGETGLVGIGEATTRTVGTRRVPPRRPLGSGGAQAPPGRRRSAQLAVAAAGGGRAHGGAGPP